MAQIRQTDKRTGTVYVYEAEAKWDPERKQTRYGKRRLVGHIDPGTGEVVPNRPTRASASSPESRREFYGACALLDAAAEESGATAAATARAGYFALFSNEVMGPFDALAVYHDKDAVEKRFGDVKGLLGFRAPRVSTEETLAGKLFVVFVALVIAAWLRRRMKEAGLDDEYTLEGLLDEVEAIERYTQEGRRPRICEATGKQRAIFNRLGYDLPATS